ncbi:MAG: nucleotidyltransferase domain-containing protein [Anaerolineae bacterium]|nr:nucleotidyltransferase domain-containing protein [Anaerolineae bacterium]
MTDDAYDSMLDLADSIAEGLIAIPGVSAVVLGGSWARGSGDEHSDIDLGIYYDPEWPPDMGHLRALAASLDDSKRGDAVTPLGAWGPWINGGAWLTVGGQRVDWLYRDLARVRSEIDNCLKGRPQAYYQAGHPHAFHSHIYMAEIALCQPLADPQGAVASLKNLTRPYPPALKRALIGNCLWEAQFALDTSRKSALRGDVSYLSGALYRCTACLLQVIYALNDRYWLNEKGSLRTAAEMPLCPRDFEKRVKQLLAHVGVGAAGLQATHHLFESLTGEVSDLCAEQGFKAN